MENQENKKQAEQTTKPIAKKKDPELFLAVFFIIFIAFIVIMTAILIVYGVTSAAKRNDDTTSAAPPVVNLPDGETPIFSGATLGTLPHKTDSTVRVTDEIDSTYGILVDASSGEILAEKGSDTEFKPASMTKVMTLIIACENLSEDDLDDKITLTEELYDYVRNGLYEGSKNYFNNNEKKGVNYIGDAFTVRDLLYGIGVYSAADCTMMIVNAIFPEDTPADAETKFVSLMQQKVQALGLPDTQFDNVIGHESDGNTSTVADIAAIMMYALKSPLIEDILSTSSHSFKGHYEKDGEPFTYNASFNSTLLYPEKSRIYDYEQVYGEFSLQSATLKGGKTGSLGDGETTSWTLSLVSFAEQDGKIYIAVTGEVSKGSRVMKDAKTLYDEYIP